MEERHRDWMILGLLALLSSAAVWTVAGVDRVYKNYDGPLYIAVAQTWYDKDLIRQRFSFPLPLEYYPAHLPLYPALIWLAGMAVENPFWSMLAVTTAGSVAGSIIFYEIARDKKWANPLLLAVLWLFVWPRMWAVRSVGSPETWFMTFVMAALWLYENKRYFWAGILGGLAVWTKSPAVLLIPTFLIYEYVSKRRNAKSLITSAMIGLFGLGLFEFYFKQMGDFWAYFHTGDNIHLGWPFHVFLSSSQIWVGTHWLEDIIWIYFIGLVGVIMAWNKNKLWAIWGGVFLAAIAMVGHRDIARYSLPLVPTVLLGFSDLLKPKRVKLAMAVMIVPLFLYTINFVRFNVMPIQNWGEFFSSSR